MKKYNVFKILSISILVTIVLSFLIPQTSFDSYGNLTKGNINPVSLIDTFGNGITSFGVFLNSFIYILCIGIFYFILHKTGKYNETINNTACMFKNKKYLFPIISIITFVVITALIGDMMPMLILVPAFIDVSRKLGYDKPTSILVTLGSIILGSTGSLYTLYSNQILGSTVTDNILFKVFILFIVIISLILFTIFFAKKPEDTKLEKIKSSNNALISIVFDVLLVLIILGVVPWSSYFGFEGFTDLYDTITNFKVFNVSVFTSIIGATLNPFGTWTVYDLSIVLLIASLVITLVYKIKFDELLETIAKSLKRSLPYALIIVFANVVLVSVYNSGFFYTIITAINNITDKLFSGTLVSMLSSLVYPDYSYASQFALSTLATVGESEFYVLLALVFQVIYSLFLLIVPTSILILLGLQYTNLSYKEWFKFIYKYILVLFALLFSVLFISSIKFIGVPSIVFIILISLIGYVILIVSILYKFVFLNNNKVEVKKEQSKNNTKLNEKKNSKNVTTKKSSSSKKPTSKSKTKKTK